MSCLNIIMESRDKQSAPLPHEGCEPAFKNPPLHASVELFATHIPPSTRSAQGICVNMLWTDASFGEATGIDGRQQMTRLTRKLSFRPFLGVTVLTHLDPCRRPRAPRTRIGLPPLDNEGFGAVW